MCAGCHLVAVRLADEQSTIAISKDVERIMDAMNKTAEEYGMRINIKKTQALRIGKNEAKQLKICIDIMEQVY